MFSRQTLKIWLALWTRPGLCPLYVKEVAEGNRCEKVLQRDKEKGPSNHKHSIYGILVHRSEIHGALGNSEEWVDNNQYQDEIGQAYDQPVIEWEVTELLFEEHLPSGMDEVAHEEVELCEHVDVYCEFPRSEALLQYIKEAFILLVDARGAKLYSYYQGYEGRMD